MKSFKEAEGYSDDLQLAYDYYKSYGVDTAERFLAAYERAVLIIQSSPYVCRALRHGWRQMVIHGYPSFSIFYQEFDKFWLFGGIISTIQDPDAILARLLIREVKDGHGA